MQGRKTNTKLNMGGTAIEWFCKTRAQEERKFYCFFYHTTMSTGPKKIDASLYIIYSAGPPLIVIMSID